MWVRAQSGKLPYKPLKLNLTTVFQAIYDNMQPIANVKSIAINHFLTDEIILNADKNMLNTVLRNLVSNSIKFTEKDGTIDIYGEQTNSTVIITVFG